jgi:hypothetical protein
MKLPFDPSHFEMPARLVTCILGAAMSAWGRLATIDPAELAIQPRHGVLIGFILALSAFIVLILRAVWGKGIETVNLFNAVLNIQAQQIAELVKLSIAALKKASLGGTLKPCACRIAIHGARTNPGNAEGWMGRFVTWIGTRLSFATSRVNATGTTTTNLFAL